MEDMYFDSRFWLDVNDRRNIWYFDYFAAKNILGFLQCFAAVADMPECAQCNPAKIQAPTEYFSRENIFQIDNSLKRLTDYFENDVCFSSEDANMLTSDLHMLMNVLPYLNERHYRLSGNKYENYRGEKYCTFEEMRCLDRALARRIAPVLREFSQCSQFPPAYFTRMYSYPDAAPFMQKEYEPDDEWRKTLDIMADAWEWLAAREDISIQGKWETVPDKVYYGLHLFAEYLPEMQND